MNVQLGGGTNIAGALGYCEDPGRCSRPGRSSSWSPTSARAARRTGSISGPSSGCARPGVRVLGLAALGCQREPRRMTVHGRGTAPPSGPRWPRLTPEAGRMDGEGDLVDGSRPAWPQLRRRGARRPGEQRAWCAARAGRRPRATSSGPTASRLRLDMGDADLAVDPRPPDRSARARRAGPAGISCGVDLPRRPERRRPAAAPDDHDARPPRRSAPMTSLAPEWAGSALVGRAVAGAGARPGGRVRGVGGGRRALPDPQCHLPVDAGRGPGGHGLLVPRRRRASMGRGGPGVPGGEARRRTLDDVEPRRGRGAARRAHRGARLGERRRAGSSSPTAPRGCRGHRASGCARCRCRRTAWTCRGWSDVAGAGGRRSSWGRPAPRRPMPRACSRAARGRGVGAGAGDADAACSWASTARSYEAVGDIEIVGAGARAMASGTADTRGSPSTSGTGRRTDGPPGPKPDRSPSADSIRRRGTTPRDPGPASTRRPRPAGTPCACAAPTATASAGCRAERRRRC